MLTTISRGWSWRLLAAGLFAGASLALSAGTALAAGCVSGSVVPTSPGNPAIFLLDSSGRIGWVDAGAAAGSADQCPQGVFQVSGSMADIAFAPSTSPGNANLWGIANNPGGAAIYNLGSVTTAPGQTNTTAQNFWNTTATNAAINVTNSAFVAGNNPTGQITSSFNALTFSPGQSGSTSGTLYALTNGGTNVQSQLYSINTTTGAATLIGSLGTSGGSAIHSSGDLAFINWNGSGPGTLVANVNLGNSSVTEMATINLGTGAATIVGTGYTGANGSFDGLANSASHNGGLFTIDSQFVYSVNTTTGVATALFKYTAGQVTGVRGAAAFGEAIPEPTSLAVLGLGMAGLAAMRRRRVALAQVQLAH